MADQNLLKTQLHELIKQHIVYDTNGRVTYVYTARADAANGDGCSKVQYSYTSLTSNQVDYMKESNSIWDASWETF